MNDNPAMSSRGVDQFCEQCDYMAIISPHASAHIPKSFVDDYPELLVSMVTAARAEWAAWTEENL